MDEAMQSLHRVDCPPPFGERYVRRGASCVVDFRLGVNQPRSHHFRTEFHHLPDAGEVLIWDRERPVSELLKTVGDRKIAQVEPVWG